MGGDYNTPTPQGSGKVLKNYTKYLPGLLSATSGEIPEVAQNTFNATAQTEPQYQQLNTDITRQFAPQLAEINSGVQRQQAIAGANTNREVLQGAGGDAARAADSLNRSINPNFYRLSDAAADKSADLLNSVNLHGLSPGEAAAVERSNNQGLTRTGNLGNNNATNIIANALNFGGAFNNKLNAASNAIQTANQTATNSSNTGFNPINIAFGQPSTSGATQLQQSGAGTQQGTQQGALGFGTGMLSNMAGMNNAAITGAYNEETGNSIPSYLGGLPSYS